MQGLSYAWAQGDDKGSFVLEKGAPHSSPSAQYYGATLHGKAEVWAHNTQTTVFIKDLLGWSANTDMISKKAHRKMTQTEGHQKK